MTRSAIWKTLSVVALLFVSACGPIEPGAAAAKAEAAWKLYLSAPDKGTYENFIRTNRAAADEHNLPHDGVGVEYQLRALEIQAAEAERTHDESLADDVAMRVDDIGFHELTGVYEEVRPGAKARLSAAKARAQRVFH